MTSDKSNNALNKYNILVSVKPSYFQTKFPFNQLDKEKLDKLTILIQSSTVKNKSGGRLNTGKIDEDKITIFY